MPLLPRSIDGDYRGQRLAPWVFGVIVLMRVGIALNTIFNGAYVARAADGIPLDAFPAAAAQTLVAAFAIWGDAQLALGLVALVVLVRYRSALPFMFLVLIAEQLGRTLVLIAHPVARVGAPPGQWIQRALLVSLILGFGLSLWNRRRDRTGG